MISPDTTSDIAHISLAPSLTREKLLSSFVYLTILLTLVLDSRAMFNLMSEKDEKEIYVIYFIIKDSSSTWHDIITSLPTNECVEGIECYELNVEHKCETSSQP